MLNAEKVSQLGVTTNVEYSETTIEKAKQIAEKLNVPYFARQKQTLKQVLCQYATVLVVYKQKLVYVNEQGEKLFFHPNTAMIRIKQGKEPLLELIGEEMQSILDLTMGLAGDSIVMSHAGHTVRAIEENPIIYTIVSEGLKTYNSGIPAVNQAMRHIQTYQGNHLLYLKDMPEKSVDVIYLDPMFSTEIAESTNLAPLKSLAYYTRHMDEVLREAKRVARRQIILKAHYQDTIFEDYGFIRLPRKTAKFHFGYYRISDE